MRKEEREKKKEKQGKKRGEKKEQWKWKKEKREDKRKNKVKKNEERRFMLFGLMAYQPLQVIQCQILFLYNFVKILSHI